MANYSDIKTTFRGILNRRDITPSLVDSFIQMGIGRTERSLRIPAMERMASYVVDQDWPGGAIVPPDFLELISIGTDVMESDVPQKLRRVDLQTVGRALKSTGCPQVFARQGGLFLIGPTPSDGTSIVVNYFGQFPKLVEDGDTNYLTDGAPDLVIYGGLSFAADYFQDDRKQLFEMTFQQALSELNDMAYQDEITDGAIGPMFNVSDW